MSESIGLPICKSEFNANLLGKGRNCAREVSDRHLRCCSILVNPPIHSHTSLLCCAFVCFVSGSSTYSSRFAWTTGVEFSVRVLPGPNQKPQHEMILDVSWMYSYPLFDLTRKQKQHYSVCMSQHPSWLSYCWIYTYTIYIYICWNVWIICIYIYMSYTSYGDLMLI